jgi:hypothetical protein
MLNGFEFGLFALAAFGLINAFWGVAVTLDAPPVLETRPNWKALEAGIPTEGAELIAPAFKEEVRVG